MNSNTKAHSELGQTSEIELLAKIVTSFQLVEGTG